MRNSRRRNWLTKAPRRKQASRAGMRCEPLEPRQMLSANTVDPSLGYSDAQIAQFNAAQEEAFTPLPLITADGDDTTNPFGPLTDLPINGTLDNTFRLHSNPTANHTIYLDFTGHRTDGTPWNADQPDGALIDTLPWDVSGDPFDGFTDEERLIIQETFLRTSETFSPFNVNVTTEAPADLDDLMRGGALDDRWGIRVVIGGSSLDWFEPLAEEPTISGIAFLNSFNSPIDNPTFVFGDGITSADTLNQIIAHEVGHTLGLSHDGILAEPGYDPDAEEPGEDDPPLPEGPVEYYPGHENNVWGSIMGAAFTATVQQWSIGEYFRADNQQDDLAIIAGPANGFGYRQDAFGDDVLSAAPLDPEPPTSDSILDNTFIYKQSGIIERNTDVDVFEFFSAPGDISIEAMAANFGPMLDIRLDLYNSAGTLVASAAPGASVAEPDAYELNATLDYTVPLQGMYYLAVTGDGSAGIGEEDEPLFTGYTDYGSVGEYSIDINARRGPMPDEYESNDFFATAYEAPYGDYTFMPSLHLGGDEDYFKWTAGEDGTLDIDLLFEHAEADLDLIVYNGSGNQIAASGSLTDNEAIDINVVAGEDYFIRVFTPSASTIFQYTLTWDGPGDPVDAFEDNNTPETAVNLGDSSDPHLDPEFAELANLSIHRPDDEDYFDWVSPGDGTLDLELTFDHEQANINVEILQDGTVVAAGNSIDDNELVQFPVTQGTAYQFRIYAQPSVSTIAPGDAVYSLRVDGPEINEDPFEPNDIAEFARDVSGLSGVQPDNLSIDSPNDIDIFRWTADQTGDLRARVFFFQENGDIDLRIRSGLTGLIIGTSTSVTDNESVTQRVVAGQTYYIEVYGHEGATQSNYFLDLAFAAAIPLDGDYNGNGFVDGLDRNLWRASYGETGTDLPADGNNDGIVNAADYTIWLDNAGEGLEPEDYPLVPQETPSERAYFATPERSTSVVPTASFASSSASGSAPATVALAVASGSGLAGPLSETFALSSNPTANHTIYLDFDGHITEDPYWDAVLIGEENLPPGRFGLPFLTPAFTLDGDGATFNDDELMMIQEAYLRVAEDFAPFNVNVTTAEPPLGDLLLDPADPTDSRWGVRIAIGGSTFDWYTRTAPNTPGQPAGGVALLGSFGLDLDTPAYVFTADGTPNAKTIALTASHEAGHTLGLAHDGNFIDPVNIPVDPEDPPTEPQVNEYYPGHGDWGPIMGAPFSPPITQWSQGEYFLANNQEDDLSIITSNGFDYRVDDYDDNFGNAAFLLPDYENNSYEVSGLIERNTDIDWFTFEADPGEVVIQANPAAVGANLDIKIEVLDEFGNPVASNGQGDPAPDFNQSASFAFFNLLPTRYYVSIQGDAFASNPSEVALKTLGYTDYGSLGEYTISISADLGEQPDAFEGPLGNDDETRPFDLGSGDHFLPGLSIHEDGDEDWFLWEAADNGQLTVDLTFQHSLGDLELKLYTETGTQLAFSGSSNNNESATIDVVEGQKYLIRAYGFGGAMLESYDLRVDGPGIAADSLEYNNTVEFASILGSTDQNRQLALSFDGDEDWFEWLAPSAGTLTVDALFDREDLELTIELYDAGGSLVATSTDIPAGDRAETSISLNAPSPGGPTETLGLYRIRIFSEANDPAKRVGEYQLILDGSELTPGPNEPNNTESTATPLVGEFSRFFGQSIYTASDRDFYSYTPEANGILEISLIHLYDFGDLDARLVSETGQVIAIGTSRNDNEGLVGRVVGGQKYFVEVYGFEGATHAAYTLEAEFTETPPVAGDYNQDGFVSLRDKTAWLEDYGMVGADLPADGNGDGIVNAADFTIWQDNVGSGFEVGDGRYSHDPSLSAALPAIVSPATATTRPAETPIAPTRPAFVSAPRSTPVEDVDSVSVGLPIETSEPLATTAQLIENSSIEAGDLRSRALLLALDAEQATSDEERLETTPSDEENDEVALAELDAAFGLSI